MPTGLSIGEDLKDLFRWEIVFCDFWSPGTESGVV